MLTTVRKADISYVSLSKVCCRPDRTLFKHVSVTDLEASSFCCSRILCWASQLDFSSSNTRLFSSSSLYCASKFLFICSWRRSSWGGVRALDRLTQKHKENTREEALTDTHCKCLNSVKPEQFIWKVNYLKNCTHTVFNTTRSHSVHFRLKILINSDPIPHLQLSLFHRLFCF